MSVQHFLNLLDLSSQQLHQLIERAIEMKAERKNRQRSTPLAGKTLAMIFDKSSTRTRVSFEAGITQLGGAALFLSPRDTQLGRGEPIEDSARVLSRMVDGIVIRTFDEKVLKTFADYSQVPVINGLTDRFHPCQLLADMLTYVEHRGSIQDKTVVWVGDGNNMCHSYINAAIQFGFNLKIACPQGYDPEDEILNSAGDQAEIIRDPHEAAKNADLVVTDVWASMGQEEEQKAREIAFADYQVNSSVMQQAHSDALFMHCLPAHRDEEVSTEVLEGSQSVVWDEAGNRLHAQNALLELLLKD